MAYKNEEEEFQSVIHCSENITENLIVRQRETNVLVLIVSPTSRGGQD